MANASTKWVRVGDVCEIAHCISDFVSESVWLLNLDMVEQQTGRVIERVYVPVEEMGLSIVPFDSRCVLYSKLRPNLNKVVLPDSVGFATSEMLPLLPNDSLTTREYLAAFLRSDSFVRYATTKSFGAKMPRLGTKDLMAAQIPLPSLAEQKRIAEVLDKISAMKRNAEARVQKLDLLVKSRFVEMFGTIEDGKFPLASLGGICEFIKDGTHQTPTYTTDIAHGYKFLSSKDVTTGHIDWTHIKYIPADLHEELYKRIAPRRNDILLAKNGTTGIAALVDTDEVFDIYVSLALLRFKQGNDVRYLLAAINSSETKRQFDSHLKGIGVPNLHLGEIKKAQIPIPPLALQREFAAFVEKVEKLKATAQRECEQVDLLYRAKLQEYFG